MNLTAAALRRASSLIGGPCFADIPRRSILKSAAAPLLGSRLVAANDHISLAFIGTGVMGSENLRAAMAHPGVAVAAVCDVYQPNLERAAALARRDGQRPKEVRDFREILADKSHDVDCISGPVHVHPYTTY